MSFNSDMPKNAFKKVSVYEAEKEDINKLILELVTLILTKAKEMEKSCGSITNAIEELKRTISIRKE
jgi:hypothetical protein